MPHEPSHGQADDHHRRSGESQLLLMVVYKSGAKAPARQREDGLVVTLDGHVVAMDEIRQLTEVVQ